MAIGYGVAVPKGKTKRQLKARKDREDAKQLKAFRDAVWLREYCRYFAWHVPMRVDQIVTWAECQHCHARVYRGADVMMTGEVHHRISRRHKATRYDPDNGVLLCNHLVNNCHQCAELGLIIV